MKALIFFTISLILFADACSSSPEKQSGTTIVPLTADRLEGSVFVSLNDLYDSCRVGDLTWYCTSTMIFAYDLLHDSMVYHPGYFPIASTNLHTITAASNGDLWIGSHGDGLFRIHDDNVFHYTSEDSTLPSDEVRRIVEGPDHTIWIGTESGIVTYAHDSFQFIAPVSAESFHFAADLSIWCGSIRGGVYQFRDGKWLQYVPMDGGNAHYTVRDALVDDKNQKWLCTDEGLFVYKDVENEPVASFLHGQWVYTITREAQDVYIVEASDGLYRIANNTVQSLPVTQRTFSGSPPCNYFKTMVFDTAGILWVGTYQNGLARFDGRQWITYDQSTPNGPGNHITHVTVDHNNHVWVASSESAITTPLPLCMFDGKSWTRFPQLTPYYFAIDGDGTIITGEGTTLQTLAHGASEVKTTTLSFIIDDETFVTSSTGDVWVSSTFQSSSIRGITIQETDANGIYSFRGSNAQDHLPLSWGWFHQICFDSRGVMYGVMLHDIYRRSENGFAKVASCDYYPTEIGVDSKNRIWAGTTDGGLFVWDGVQWKNFTPLNSPLISNDAPHINIDRHDNVWVSNHWGLVRLNAP